MPLTHEDRVRYGRLGAYTRLAAAPDWSAVTEAARAKGPANLDWHAKRIDPEGILPPAQRYKMAEASRTAFYLDLSERSRKARAARKGPPQAPPQGAA